MKLVYIGAGSFRFSYGFFKNIVAADELFPLDVWLVDIDEPLLRIMQGVLTRMATKWQVPVTVHATTQRREALPGADVIFKSISIGQQASEWYDIHVPIKFGIPQNTGDTCGPGGIFRSLRCVPVAGDIVRDVAELCPHAPLFNYTNPQASIVLGARRAAPRVQTIGVCHELLAGMPLIPKLLRKVTGKDFPSWERFDITYSGVNHYAWLLSCKYNGEDLMPMLRDHAKEGEKVAGRPFNFYLLGKYGYFPYAGSRHVAEFMPEYYNFFTYQETSRKIISPRLRNVRLLERARHAAVWAYRQVAKGRLRPPKPSKKGERAIEMTISHRTSDDVVHVVNLPNTGHNIIENLPENCILEVPSRFKNGTCEGFHMGSMPPEIVDLVRVHAENTSKFVEAAESGSPDKLLKALLADPMCQFIDDADAVEDLMWNMLFYEQEWLPTFRDSIPTLEDLQKRKRHVDRKILLRGRAQQVLWPPRAELRKKAIILTKEKM